MACHHFRVEAPQVPIIERSKSASHYQFRQLRGSVQDLPFVTSHGNHLIMPIYRKGRFGKHVRNQVMKILEKWNPQSTRTNFAAATWHCWCSIQIAWTAPSLHQWSTALRWHNDRLYVFPSSCPPLTTWCTEGGRERGSPSSDRQLYQNAMAVKFLLLILQLIIETHRIMMENSFDLYYHGRNEVPIGVGFFRTTEINARMYQFIPAVAVGSAIRNLIREYDNMSARSTNIQFHWPRFNSMY